MARSSFHRRTLKLMTYNIHNGVGRDRRYDLDRIARVIEEEWPDIVALQEVDQGMARSGFDDQPRQLAERLGMHHIHCRTLSVGRGGFGNTVLSRFPFAADHQFYDISHPAGREPRWCIRADLDLGEGEMLHVFNCHLGLAQRERAWQQRRMLSDAILLSRDIEHPVVLMGDFNDRPFPVVHARLREYFKDAYKACGRRYGPTFRVGPLHIKLDHIYTTPEVHVEACWVRREPPANVASDHRPLVALVTLEWR